MARQTSSKVIESTLAPTMQPPDLREVSTTVMQSEAEDASKPVPSVVTLDEVKRNLRHLMIRQAAYQIHAQRGYVDGFELADWFQAEAEVDRVLGDHTTVN
jgi:hypothetical protein